MENKRWVQRFHNFEKTLYYLHEALQINEPDIIQKAGLIQFFELSFELAWNTMKDYLQEQGFTDIKSPRAAIKKAFEVGLIEDGHSWLKLLEDRNLTSHAYDEETVNEIEILVRNNYNPLFKKLSIVLNKEKNG